jgi:hypothetical protein
MRRVCCLTIYKVLLLSDSKVTLSFGYPQQRTGRSVISHSALYCRYHVVIHALEHTLTNNIRHQSVAASALPI